MANKNLKNKNENKKEIDGIINLYAGSNSSAFLMVALFIYVIVRYIKYKTLDIALLLILLVSLIIFYVTKIVLNRKIK